MDLVEESVVQSLTERCSEAVAFMQRRTDAFQLKIYVRGKQRDSLRAESSFINSYNKNGLVVRYEQGKLEDDFIVFERK